MSEDCQYSTPWELEHKREYRLYCKLLGAVSSFRGNMPEEARAIRGEVFAYARLPVSMRDLGTQRRLNRLYATAIERLELIQKFWGEGGN